MKTPRYLAAFCNVLTLICSFQANDALAKGLEELKPGPNSEADQNADAENKADPEGTENEDKNTEAVEANKLSFTREAGSALNDKAFLELSYGLVRASASEGDWRASGMTDVTFKYKFKEATTYALLALGRFAPFDVTVYEEKVGYRGTVNAYYIGGETRFKFNHDWYASASAELGLMAVYLEDLAGIGTNSDLEKNGTNFSVGLSANRQLWDFLWIGPKMHYGVGRFSIIQFSLASALMF